MGRLAGPLGPKWQAASQAQKKMWEDRRRHIASITPLVHPPAARRQMALLWYVAHAFDGAMMIGWRNSPPLTDDMRALIRRGQLALMRTSHGSNIVSPPRTNRIVVTPTGTSTLACTRISDADKHYVEMAVTTGVVR